VNRVDPAALKTYARAAGFDLCGIATADRHPRLARLADWIARGCAGDMHYLARSLDERLDPARLLVSARSVISVAVVYNTAHDAVITADGDAGERALISRYAWGEDYHDVIRPRLRRLLTWLAGAAGPGLEAVSSVDAAPLQERVFAERAGLGWIGKHTCLINEQIGSWFFLGAIVSNAELATDTPAIDRCGTCRRCLDACPTGAIGAPYELDATRCLSYLTIETRASVPEALRASIGPHVFGCDVCQEVCPWNRRAVSSPDPAWQPRDGLAFPRMLALCTASDATWREWLKDSAMRRAGLRRIRRSLAYACASLPPESASTALAALAGHESARDPQVAEAIAWAQDALDRAHRPTAGSVPG
jgi:epoxyqueuosine reductase